jgi:predicted transcriptional regulator
MLDHLVISLQVLAKGPCEESTLAATSNVDIRDLQRYLTFAETLRLAVKYDHSFLILDKGRKFLQEYRKLRTFRE